jgi:hypothetical protein
MREINKAKKIFKGFFPDETVSEEVKKERRDICGGCEYNSANTPSDKLSPIDYLRHKITGPPFCTLCKCQLHEKTQSPFEECAAYMANEPKKWFKTRLETMGNENINITNVSDLKVDLQLVNDKFVIDYGAVDNSSPTDLELLVDTNSTDKFKLHSVNPTCGCSVTKYHTIDNRGTINVRMNLAQLGLGKFSKEVNIEYVIGNIPYKAILVLTGFKQ